MKPKDVELNDGFMTDALGNSECEFMACIVVRWHIANGYDDWIPVSLRALASFVHYDEVVIKWMGNPFWIPDPLRLREQGWIDGWTTPDEPGTFSENALHCMEHRGEWKKLRKLTA